MISYNPTLISELSDATKLPVYWEQGLDSSPEFPCITYRELNDTAIATGDTLQYSNVTYAIKLWGESLSSLTNIYLTIDDTMKSLGFIRTSYNTVTYGADICLVGNYQGLAKYEITNEG